MFAVLPYLCLFLAPELDLRRVERMLEERKYEAALEQLRSTETRDAHWHILASRAWDALNNPAKAVQEAEEALRLDPGNPAHHLQLAQIFLSRNTPAAALEILTESQTLFPNAVIIRLGKGLAHKELQQYEQAESSFLWCLSRQPDSALAFDGLATIYLQQLRFEDLQSLSSEFRKHNGSDYRGYYFLAAALDGKRMPASQSLSLLEKSLERNPSFAAAYALSGKILMRENAPARALPLLKRAIELRPDLVEAHLNLARAFRVTGEEAASVSEFEVVRKLKAKGQESVPSLRYHRGSR